jgi:hypothetical protein
MKPALIYTLILAFAFLKGDDHSFSPAKQINVSNSTQYYQHNNISGSNHKRSPVDLFASAACCDDNDDEFEPVKKKTGSTVSFLPNNVFEEVLVHNELKRTQHVSKYADHNSQPVYIFQRELLI